MSEISRTGAAVWLGEFATGIGEVSTESFALRNASYTCGARFERGEETNPEEILAAALAAGFTMTLAKLLSDEGRSPRQIRTKARVVIVEEGRSFRIARTHLDTEGEIETGDDSVFQEAAERAKQICMVCRLLTESLDSVNVNAVLYVPEPLPSANFSLGAPAAFLSWQARG